MEALNDHVAQEHSLKYLIFRHYYNISLKGLLSILHFWQLRVENIFCLDLSFFLKTIFLKISFLIFFKKNCLKKNCF